MSDSRYMNTLDKIQSHLELLSKSERKVAEVIPASPQTAIHSSIATLARMADVSEPTVNRFCRRLDTKGFPDFKLHLAQSPANGTPYVNRNVEEDDSVDSYTSKIFESVMASPDTVKANLDIAAINRAVDLLTRAKDLFLRPGASAAVAHDAMNKFFRFNIPVVYFDDIVMQRMSCMNSGEGDVVVLIHTPAAPRIWWRWLTGARKRRHGIGYHLARHPARSGGDPPFAAQCARRHRRLHADGVADRAINAH